MIFNLVMEASVNPADQCTHRNFPQFQYYLRATDKCPSVFSSYRNLRLVCRTFRDLLESPPWLCMAEEHILWVKQIHPSIRAVYVPVWANSVCSFQRIIADRTPSRIVSLDIPCDITSRSDRALSLDLLCRKSHKLTGIRYLALQPVHRNNGLDIKSWAKLNASFPDLSCLKLSSYVSSRGLPTSVLSEDQSPVVFKNLQVLNVGDMDLHPKLRFPILRHVALYCLSRETITILAHSRGLESLLIRSSPVHEIDISPLPNLRLLGIPARRDYFPFSVIPTYQLDHICLHLQSAGDGTHLFKWITLILSRQKYISRLTIDFTSSWNWSLWKHVKVTLTPANLSAQSINLSVRSLQPDDFFVIMERTLEQSGASSSLDG